MKTTILSPYPERLHVTNLPLYDVLILYGHREILSEEFIRNFKGRIINLHISLLPYNKGADPNFWSWFDGTPKGVTIHTVDKGIDTGRILLQKEVAFDGTETLATSYEKLHTELLALFHENWPQLLELPSKANTGGTFHVSKEKEHLMKYFPLGWNTPVSVIEEFGAETRDSNYFWSKCDQEIAEICT